MCLENTYQGTPLHIISTRHKIFYSKYIDARVLPRARRRNNSNNNSKMGILERIADIEKEMSRTQKNKATESHLGTLKAKLAKLKRELLEPAKGGGNSEERGFEVNRYGHGRVALIGFPSVGKSSLLNQLCGTQSEAAAYEFTTLTCIPGVLYINDAKMQLLDLPGIIEGAADGKGRGR